MIRRPPRSTRPDTLFPYTTLFRSISGHRQLLGQALANLLDNAVKYSPRGGQIRMSLGRIDDAADLTVADSGPGIPAEDRARVLERFVRLDTSRGAPGSGLGLSLVAARSEERRVGKVGVRPGRSRWSPHH